MVNYMKRKKKNESNHLCSFLCVTKADNCNEWPKDKNKKKTKTKLVQQQQKQSKRE